MKNLIINSRIYKIIVLFMFLSSISYSQNLDKSRFGVFGNSVINIYNANFPALDSIPSCCVNYLTGNGISLNLGVFWSQNLSSHLFLDLRMSYLGLSGDFYSYENKPVSIISNNKEEIVIAKIQHNISARIGTSNLDLNLKYFPIQTLSIYGGFGLGFVITNEFDQEESLIEPSEYGTFENRKRIRNEFTGKIKNINNLLFRANLGISNDFYLNRNKSLIFSPELSYHIGFNSYIKSHQWLINNVRLGFAIIFAPKEIDESPLDPKKYN